MKLFKKILSTVLSFGMIFSSALSLRVFAGKDDETPAISTSEIPTNLEECCLKLDEILSQEEKNKIKQSSVYSRGSYVYNLTYGSIGQYIKTNWLYLSPTEGSKKYVQQISPLGLLLLSHGAAFLSERDSVMISIILDNYGHYLNGENGYTIEDLIINHWYSFFDQYVKKEKLRNMLEQWFQNEESRRQNTWSIISKCNIL